MGLRHDRAALTNITGANVLVVGKLWINNLSRRPR
jgi:hypothetical protein